MKEIPYRDLKRLCSTFLLSTVLLIPLISTCRASSDTVTPLDEQALDRYIQQEVVKNRLPGIAVAIVRGEEVVYLKGFGYASLTRKTPVTPQTIFDLASCSKSFTALAVLNLWQDGLIDLDKPLANYIPEFRLAEPDVSASITVRQLLYQTSGLPGVFSEPLAFFQGKDAMNQLVAAMAKIHPDRAPGSSFEYTNLNYALLGALVERVSGVSLEDYFETRIFSLLRMNNSTLRPEAAAVKDRADGHQLLLGKVVTRNTPVYRSVAPAGWVMSSAEDMAKWLALNLNNGKIDGKQVIASELIEMMHTAGVECIRDGEKTGYGMGWFVDKTEDGNPVVWHGGDTTNFLAEMILLPEEKLGIATLVNGQTCAGAHNIAPGIARLVTGKQINLPLAPWWSSWKSIDNISIYATILAIVLVLGLIPYIWWQVHVINRLRKPGTDTLPRKRRIKIWGIVLPVTGWMLVAAIVSIAYAVMQTLFGFNVFRIIIRFGFFAPPGVIVAAVATITAILFWAIAISVTTIFRSVARGS
jgi:CubicO group peptidase (beta-lactamase class C family)